MDQNDFDVFKLMNIFFLGQAYLPNMTKGFGKYGEEEEEQLAMQSKWFWLAKRIISFSLKM